MKSGFVHLQVHSSYSLHYGTATIAELAGKAREAGFDALTLTDINNLYGMHEFIKECRERGLRSIIGAEITNDDGRAVVLVKNRGGFSNLCQLITARMGEKKTSLIEGLKRYSGGNVVLTDTTGLLRGLRGSVEELYAMITPFSQGIVVPAAELSLPLAATGEVTLLSREDRHVHRVLRAIAARSTVGAIKESDCAPEGPGLFSAEKAYSIFSDFPEALENAARIAERCAYSEIFSGYVFPRYTSVKGDAASELRRRTIDGAERRYGELSESVMERIDYELDIIQSKGFSSYFLLVADIVSRSSRTCGRGSAAACIVSYSLGITNVDPIRYNLYFERFLNPEREDPPDIDVDFAWDERDTVIEQAMESFGVERCAMVSTHIHYRELSAIRDVARAYGIPDPEITGMGKRLARRNRSVEGDGLDAVWKEVFRVAGRIMGFMRHLGVHVGGLIITPWPVSRYVPVETAPKGVPIATWDKDGVEDAGLLKIDLLGNRSLAVVRDALAALEKQGIVIACFGWDPANDTATRRLLALGDTMGVFYVESPAMRQLQKKTGAGDFEHLVIHSSMIRPAANRFISEYINRLKGKPYASLHPRLDHILKETYGIMCYQEDVSKVAIALANFSAAEADGLRKILTKKNHEKKLAEYREKFFQNAAGNGVSAETTRAIWEMIESFDGYSFCKPHSASYAMVSFQSAYLKAHYPAQFMAAVLSNGGGYYTAAAYISEAKRMGLTILPPDVNESGHWYYGYDDRIRVGFGAVAELKNSSIRTILDERNSNGVFKNTVDFIARTALPPADVEILIAVGALDSLSAEKNRHRLLWTALFGGSDAGTHETVPLPFMSVPADIPAVKDQSFLEKLQNEYRYLGFLCEAHPLYFWEKSLKGRRSVQGRDLEQHVGRKIEIVGWPITRKAVLASNGMPMEFVSFEDETAIFETVFFPEAYEKYGYAIEGSAPYIITGKVDDDRGAVNICVEKVRKV